MAPEQVDGDLIELDLAAMDALFAKIHDAEMSDEQFAASQIARNVPAIGRGRELRHHQRSKYRRSVLRELVQWWVGIQQQQGRDLPEVHRRFFYRFGIDIGTAFTLPADDTDKLINKIKLNFSEDLTL